MNKSKTLKFVLGLLTILALPVISAYWGGGGSSGYYDSPLAYLDNEWIRFGIIFLLLFAVIYYAVSKTFKNNTIALVVAGGVSLLISISMGQRGLLYSYAGDSIGNLAIMVGFLIAIFALFRVLIGNFGAPGGITLGIISTLILGSIIDLGDILPGGFAPLEIILDWFGNFMRYYFGLFIIIGFAILIFFIFGRKANLRKKAKKWQKRIGID